MKSEHRTEEVKKSLPAPSGGPDFPVSSPREDADIVTSSDDYAARFAGATGTWMLRIQEDIVLRLLEDFPRATLLDVGGGHGQLAGPLSGHGADVTVLGSSAECKKRIAPLVDSGRCRFVVGDILSLPFPDRRFDIVISVRLLPHCRNWPALIGEMCRVARHAVIVDYPTSQSLNALAPFFFSAKKKLEGNTRSWSMFRHDEVEREFHRHGYGSIRREAQFFLPMVLHRLMRTATLSAFLERASRSLGLTGRWGSPVILEARRGDGEKK